jgi:hypothetical protein
LATYYEKAKHILYKLCDMKVYLEKDHANAAAHHPYTWSSAPTAVVLYTS